MIITYPLACFTFYLLFLRTNKDNLSNALPTEFILLVNKSKNSQETLQLDPSKIGLYLNYHDTYSCPYYTDRVDLIAPEINRLAQFCRALGISIIFNSKTDEPTKIDPQVKSEVDETVKTRISLHLQETSPLVQDKCLYEDFDANPTYSNGSIHHQILYSTSNDLFVSINEYNHDLNSDNFEQIDGSYSKNSHIDVVYLAKQKHLTHLIVGGMKCNMWMSPLFEQLKEVGIQPIYLYDLSDVVFLRSAQQEKIDTHLIALRHFWTWINKKYGMIVNHFDILDRPFIPSSSGPNIYFDGNPNAYSFKEYFDPNYL